MRQNKCIITYISKNIIKKSNYKNLEIKIEKMWCLKTTPYQ